MAKSRDIIGIRRSLSRPERTFPTRGVRQALLFVAGFIICGISSSADAQGGPGQVADPSLNSGDAGTEPALPESSAAPALPDHLRAEVPVVVVGPEAERARLIAALGEPLGRLSSPIQFLQAETLEVHEIINPTSTAGDAPARVWIDLRNRDDLMIFLVDAGWQRVLIRHVSAEGGAEMSGERVALIVQSSLEVLLEGGVLGVARDEARRQLDLPTPATPVERETVANTPQVPDPSFFLGADLIYRGAFWHTRVAPLHGPRLQLASQWALDSTTRIGVSLTGGGIFPQRYTEDSAGMLTWALHVVAGLSIEAQLADNLIVGGHVGAGMQLVDVVPVDGTDSSLVLEGPQQDLTPLLEAGVSVWVPLYGGLAMGLRVGAMFDPADHRFYVQRASRQESILNPWLIWPYGDLAIRFRVPGS